MRGRPSCALHSRRKRLTRLTSCSVHRIWWWERLSGERFTEPTESICCARSSAGTGSAPCSMRSRRIVRLAGRCASSPPCMRVQRNGARSTGSHLSARRWMLDALKWNVRLAQASTPDLIEKFKAALKAIGWTLLDADYEPCDPAREADAGRLLPGSEGRNGLAVFSARLRSSVSLWFYRFLRILRSRGAPYSPFSGRVDNGP